MRKFQKNNGKKHKQDIYWTVSGLIVISMIILVEIFYNQYLRSYNDSQRIESLKIAQSSALHIQEEINHRVYVVDTMKFLLINTGFDVSKFDSWAPHVFGTEPGISSVQLAPDGIVQYIYPLEGNEAAIGHDLLKDNKRDDGARVAIESDKLTFIGPVKLIQNNKQAVIVRRPIFKNNSSKVDFWGFCTVILLIEDIHFDDYFDNELYDYWITGYDPDSNDSPYVYGNVEASNNYDAKVTIAVPNGQWQLYVRRRTSKYKGHLRLVLVGIELILVLIILYLRHRKFKQDDYIYKLVNELQIANQTDSLTGIYNRSFFEETMKNELERHRRYKTEDSLIMFDIDHFKYINDEYGHQTGDIVLRKLSTLVNEHKRKSDIFARWGGEEFFLFLPKTSGEDAVDVADKLRELIQLSKFVDGLTVTCSFGVCEIDDRSYDDLFRTVDNAVYEAKNKGRNQTIYY